MKSWLCVVRTINDCCHPLDWCVCVTALTAIFSSYAATMYKNAVTAREFYMAFKLGCCAGLCGTIFFTFLSSIRYGTQFQ